MKLLTLSAACAAAFTLSFAGGAQASESIITAKLQNPVSAKTKVIAGGAIFACEADACVALEPTSQTYALAACKSVAKVAGPLAAFGSPARSLDADKLGACNASAKMAAR